MERTVYTINKFAHPCGCNKYTSTPVLLTRCRNHLQGHQKVLPQQRTFVLLMKSRRVLLSNECLPSGHRTLDFLPADKLCGRCHGHRARRDGGGYYLCSAWVPHCLAITWKMMTPIFAICQVWVLCGQEECGSLIRAFLLVSLCGWKKEAKNVSDSNSLMFWRNQTKPCIFPILPRYSFKFDAHMIFLSWDGDLHDFPYDFTRKCKTLFFYLGE